MSSPADPASERRERPCAYCRKRPALPAFRPFCSEGCRMRDLNAWLSDAYVVPANAEDDELSASSRLDKDEEAG
jgi:uncharacterized protein